MLSREDSWKLHRDYSQCRMSLHIFKYIEGQGSQLDQVVSIVEQHLESPVTEKIIQEFIEQEALVKQQFEAS
jgi:hypothetical protein